MITNHYLRCGDCPWLKVEHWPRGEIAVRCASPESPYAPVQRVLTVLPDTVEDPGGHTIRQRWCHDKKEERKEKLGRFEDRPYKEKEEIKNVKG